MKRVTKQDLENVLARYVRALEALELPNGPLELHEGSKTYGRAYRLYRNNGGNPIGAPGGYLGMTRREAVETLWTIAVTLEDVRYSRTLADMKKAAGEDN